MIHRTYFAFLPSLSPTPPTGALLDIAVRVPGTYAAPVLDPTIYPGVPATTPPASWNGLGTTGWYYEMRSRALRIEALAGATGFTPRTRLGVHLSICALSDPAAGASNGNLVPLLGASASLAPPVVASAGLNALYAVALPDPSYGPVIRIYNSQDLTLSAPGAVYMINLQISENKDDDYNTLGHA